LSAGPITLFDKSALQSFSLDEAVWFDNFYATIISPLFFVETLADLSKEVERGRTPEQVVGSIAAKTPETGSFVTVDHAELRLADSEGYEIEMGRRPHRAGGRRFQVDGRDGAFFDDAPEMAAFARWQQGDFLGVERDFAQRWRSALSTMDLPSFYPIVRSLGGGKTKLRDLAEARAIAERMVRGDGRRYTTLKVAFEMLRIRPNERPGILKRWKQAGGPSLTEFAPYTAYSLMVDLFFYLCLDAGPISSERPSNRVDVAYLYYLPFCMIFTSGDKLHQKITPLFLRDDQMFLWAPDLREDLKRLDAHFATLPEAVKAQGIKMFASHPPLDGDYLTTKLWDRFLLPIWREPSRPASETTTVKTQALVKANSDSESREKKLGEPVSSMPGKLEDLDHVVLQRRVHGRRGKWQILPSAVIERQSR
jgi:hypothetical protein